LKTKLEEEKIVFSIDEFTFLVNNDDSILSPRDRRRYRIGFNFDFMRFEHKCDGIGSHGS